MPSCSLLFVRQFLAGYLRNMPFLTVLLLSTVICTGFCSRSEPTCSKFDYDEKILEKLVRLEHKMELHQQQLKVWEETMETKLDITQDLQQSMEEMTETFQEKERNLTEYILRKESERGKTFSEKMKIHDDTVRSFIENYKTPTVVFNARDVADTDIVTGKILRFTTPIINIGGGYDENTGYFTAPYGGSYQFNAQVCSSENHYSHVYLKAAGTIIGATSHEGGHGSGTCTLYGGVTVLNKGDKCWVEGSYSNKAGLKEDAWRLNTFSGLLIHTGTG